MSAGLPYYLKETQTKREAQEFIDWAARTRVEIAERGQVRASLLADYLRSRGWSRSTTGSLSQVTGTTSTPDGPIREVTRVEHMASGVSMIWHETEDMPQGSCDRFTLHVGSAPAFRAFAQSVPGQETS